MSNPSPVDAREDTRRLEAFSDGVFAIAITLLVLDIKVPRDLPEGTRLWNALAAQWPVYLAFLISFVTIGIMWINHHRLFRIIHRVDHGLLVLNGLLLLGITFVPFPTALVAEHLLQGDERIAAMVYSGTFTLIALVFNALWWYASGSRRLLNPRANERAVKGITRAYALGPLLYLAALGVALVSVTASLLINLGLAIFFALPPRHRAVASEPST